ncbi:class I SAM-dependent methyltransferase [Psychroflexus sediminis]|uniref:Methyltransferase domain-containing protein n=1 Tax=Psychroflexus sediminis TaxID=470826 RepID=A0A1G7VZ47_9FLAO|nr:class I SAM-dependent methyltransferase [Psychroflexus sediminis]SDG65022.1 Methyltransferase domain-containing protein [Psychroflexus sediminis]
MNVKQKIKEAWPTREAMKQIYSMKLWGDNHSDFYSGIGSHHPELVKPYIEALSSYLQTFKSAPVICDLGCGDFNIGKHLVQYAETYIGVDIVEELIDYNSRTFTDENLEFRCLDIAVDDLPAAEVVILRQVLQHLSNDEIHNILTKLSHYKYLILTEHLPQGEFVPNKEIISGQGTRLKKQSGVNLLAPPFHFKVKEEKNLLTIPSEDHKGVIKTTLYTLY